MWPFSRKPRDLTEAWNSVGRDVYGHNSEQLTQFHTGQTKAPELREDTRTPELGQQVLAEAISLNAAGDWRKLRGRFDPAHAPFIPQMEENERGITAAILLGPDMFLVRRGTYYQGSEVLLIDGESVTSQPSIRAFAISRNRRYVAVVTDQDVIEIREGWDGQALASAPLPQPSFYRPADIPQDIADKWETPDQGRPALDTMHVSDDGQTVLGVDPSRGVFVVKFEGTKGTPRLLYPSTQVAPDLFEIARETIKDDPGYPYTPSLDMLHAALSPNGRYVGLGTQMDGHYLVDLHKPDIHTVLGYVSEYPHNACFSDDNSAVAFNSCHFYNGVTIAAAVEKVAGLQTAPYEEHPLAPVINSYLRVYASAWLPNNSAFLLAGSSYATATTPEGQVAWELFFGSSAGSVDVAHGRILLGSYSGMLHVLDPSETAEPGRSEGFNQPKELKRWILWDQLEQPLQW